eukprot:4780574-Pleurochrysis_carterae.AAC.1
MRERARGRRRGRVRADLCACRRRSTRVWARERARVCTQPRDRVCACAAPVTCGEKPRACVQRAADRRSARLPSRSCAHEA